MDQFDGRIAVVTGAASGIGLALAERFGREGMTVVLADIEQAALEAAATKLRGSGVNTLAVQTDVSQWDDIVALADRVFAELGTVHVLCNNAGVAGSRVRSGGIWGRSLQDWEWVLGVNLWGVIHGIHAFLPRMIDRGGEGHIVNTASLAGLGTGSGIYGVSKHAVVAFSESLRDQLAGMRARIGVSALCPGPVSTNILDAARNRPERLRGAGRIELTEEERAEDEAARRRLESGMSPLEVADAVIDGIRAQRFFIVPVPDGLRSRVSEGIRRRAESIAEAVNEA